MAIYALGDRVPTIEDGAFVHPDAIVIGDVLVEAGSSVWPTAVLRGDFGRIELRQGSSVQDGTVVHAGPDIPTIIGPDALVGHNAHLEGCVIEPWGMVASMSTVLHRCVVRSHAIVGAGAVVPNDIEVPEGAMALGVPCRILEGRVAPFANRHSVETYRDNARRYLSDLSRMDETD